MTIQTLINNTMATLIPTNMSKEEGGMYSEMINAGFPIRCPVSGITTDQFNSLVSFINKLNTITVFDLMEASGLSYTQCSFVLYELTNINLLRKIDSYPICMYAHVDYVSIDDLYDRLPATQATAIEMASDEGWDAGWVDDFTPRDSIYHV